MYEPNASLTEQQRAHSRKYNHLQTEINFLNHKIESQQGVIVGVIFEERLNVSLDRLVRRVEILELRYISTSSPNRHEANTSSFTMPRKMTRSEITPRKYETAKNVISVSVGKSSRGSPMRKWMSTMDIMPNKVNTMNNILHDDKPSLVKTINSPSIPNLIPYEISDESIQISVSNRNVRVPVPEGVVVNPEEQVAAPEKLPHLHWSFGFRAKGRNEAVIVLPTSEMVYSTGNVVILYNFQENKQRFFESHTDQVLSLALHPNKCTIASVQRRKKGVLQKNKTIIVWDSISLDIIYTIDADKLEQVCSMSFTQSDGGKFLALLESSNKAHVHIFDTSSKSFVTKEITASGHILSCAWHPTRNLLTIHGTKNLSIWEFDESSTIVQKHLAVFETDRVRKILCFCYTDQGTLATGDSSGTITLWNTDTMKIIKQAHSVHHGGVAALTLSKKGYLLTSGKDKTICEWDVNDLVRRKRPIEMPDDNGIPVCITSTDASSLIVGTSQNNLFEGSFEKGVAPAIQGDSESIQCGVSWETNHSFVTGSKDGGLRIYNIETLAVDYYRKFSDGIQCLSIESSLNVIAVGFMDGTVSLFHLSTKEQLIELSDNSNPVTSLKFSPNSQYLFLARKNLQAFVYRLGKDYKLQQLVRFSSLSAAVVNMDWNNSSEYLRANSDIGHSYYWSITGESIKLSLVRSLKWSTSSCKISYESGCVQHALRGFDNVAASEDIVYCGNRNGDIRLYRNPYTTLTAGFHEISAHSQPVSIIILNETYFISYGEDESSLLLWKLT